MGEKDLELVMESYGVSPWELEVAYGYFNSRFAVRQEELPEADPDFISVLVIHIPLRFSAEFFEWFEFRRWEKVKSLFKEMKRRRGSRKALKIRINFAGSPSISFVMDAMDKQLYNHSVEKLDFVLELLPYHLKPESIPDDLTHVAYVYDVTTRKWEPGEAGSDDTRYTFRDGAWKLS